MKKIIAIVSAALVLASCAEFTDLKPKGVNMLFDGLVFDGLHDVLGKRLRRFNSRDAAEEGRLCGGDFPVKLFVFRLFVHASSIRRRVRSAWNMRDLTVPTGTPRISETSV